MGESEDRGRSGRPKTGLAVLLTLLVAALVLLGSRDGYVVAGAIAAAPIVILAFVALSTESLVIVLIVTTQVQIGRAFLFGFRFLPEHIVLAALVAALVVRRPSAIFRRPAAYELLFLAWIGWNAIITILASPDLGRSLPIVGWMLLAWMIMWVVGGVLAETDSFDRILDAGATCAGILGLITFALWLVALVGIAHIRVQPEFVTGAVGAKGPALEANLFGCAELMWLYWLLRKRIVTNAVVPGWQITALTLGIVASMTRAVWLAMVLILIGSLFISRPYSRPRRYRDDEPSAAGHPKVVAGVIMIGLVLALCTPAGQKFSESLNFRSSTGATRISTWNVALDDINDENAWVAGLGTHSFGSRHMSRTDPGQPDYLSNFPLTVLYDSGMIGVTLLLAAMLSFILRSREPRVRLMTLLFVIAVLVAGAATSPIWFGFVWVMVAAIDADTTRRGVAFDEESEPAPRPATAVTLGSTHGAGGGGQPACQEVHRS